MVGEVVLMVEEAGKEVRIDDCCELCSNAVVKLYCRWDGKWK